MRPRSKVPRRATYEDANLLLRLYELEYWPERARRIMAIRAPTLWAQLRASDGAHGSNCARLVSLRYKQA